MAAVRVIGVSGSIRSGSSNAALLREVARLAPVGMEVILYEGTGALPHFNPDLDQQAPPLVVQELRALLEGSGGIVISCPEYAHGVPGTFKNALDWLVSDGALVDKPVLLLNAAPYGGERAQAAIVQTLLAMNWNVLTEACRLEPFLRTKLAGDDTLSDPEAIAAIQASLTALGEVTTKARG